MLWCCGQGAVTQSGPKNLIKTLATDPNLYHTFGLSASFLIKEESTNLCEFIEDGYFRVYTPPICTPICTGEFSVLFHFIFVSNSYEWELQSSREDSMSSSRVIDTFRKINNGILLVSYRLNVTLPFTSLPTDVKGFALYTGIEALE